MRKWFLILVCVFMVGFLGSQGKVWAAEAECSAGDQYCKDIDTRCYCNSSYTYSCYTCSNICSKGVCVAAPTATPTPSNCTYGGTTYANGTNRCTSGTLYKCNNGSWSFYVDCTYGSCKDNTTCASCRQGTNKCNGSRLEQCNNSSWVLVENCVYGCDTSTNTCFDCTGTGISCRNGSQYECTNGRWVYSWHCWGLGCKDSSKCNYVMCGPFGEGDPYDFSEVTFDSNCKPVANYCQPGSVLYKPELEYLDEGFEYASWNWVWSCTDKYGECNSGAITYRNPYCGTVTCDMAWSGSQCVTNAYCKTPLGSVSGCPSGSTCCNDPWVDECKSDSNCVNIYGACYKCNNNIPRKCYRSIASGGDGNCASLGSVCSLPASGLCSSSYGSTVTDSSGTDGTFNWTCSGQSSATCRTAGSSVSCSATRSVINATCGSAETDSSCTAPTTNLCSSGTASSVTTNATTFTWTCTGSCGGTNDSCTKTRSIIDGECGSADGGNFASTPTSGLCSVGTTSTVKVNPITYTWTCDRKCNGSIDSCLATRDIAPTFPVPTVPTSPGATDPISNPSGGVRLHNCQFPDASQMTIKVAVSDANGLDDIGNIYLRFSGQSTEYGPVSPVSGVATFNLDITSVPNGVYTVQAKADDVHSPISSGWVNLSYQFKKWDCLVNVSGTFYDGSNAPILCATGLGYTTPIPSGLNFDLRYQIGTSAPRIMTVNSPNFSADNNNRLYWNSPVDYQPQLAYFPGTDPTQARINGNCYNTSALDPKIADPYLTNPSLTIEYSTVLDQSAWYRASGGAIITKGTLTNYVPGTCTAANCMTVAGNIILSDGKASLSPYDKINSNIVYDNQTVDFKLYSYDTLKRKYFFTKGYGTTVPASITNWTDVETKSGVIFVEGDLTIDTNIATTDLVMIVAKGDITINPNVTRVDGILFGKSITASGESASQLVINGSIYGLNSVVLNRSLNPKKSNNTTPAVEVRYNPSLIFKLPAKMIQNITRWRLLQ